MAFRAPADTPSDVVDRNVRNRGDRETLVDRHGRLTWREVKVLSDRLALGFVG